MFLIETQRKYPPLNLTRDTKQDYRVPGTDYVIEKGTQVWIPAYAIQHDHEYYPNPERFDPDRFTAAEVAKRDSALWMPFGAGPRNCVGLRFGRMQTRIALVLLILNFRFHPSARTQKPLQFDCKALTLMPANGMWLRVEKII